MSKSVVKKIKRELEEIIDSNESSKVQEKLFSALAVKAFCQNKLKYKNRLTEEFEKIFTKHYSTDFCYQLKREAEYWEYDQDTMEPVLTDSSIEALVYAPQDYVKATAKVRASATIPFPAEVLPQVLRDYCNNITDCIMYMQPDFVYAHVISFLAAMIGNGAVLEIKKGFTKFPLMVSVYIASQSSGKTALHTYLSKAIVDRENLWKKELGIIKKHAEVRNDERHKKILQLQKVAIEAELKGDIKKANSKKEEALKLEKFLEEIPSDKQIIYSDITEAKFFVIMGQNNGSIFVMCSDADKAFKTLLGTHFGNGNSSSINDAFSGSYSKVGRINRESNSGSNNCCPNALIDIQPFYINTILNKEYCQNGLLSRIFLCMMEENIQNDGECEIGLHLQNEYLRIGNILLDLHERGIDGKGTQFRLSANSLKRFNKLNKELRRESKKYKGYDAVAGWLSKAAEHTAKLALVLMLTDKAAKGKKPPKTVATAYFKKAEKVIAFYKGQMIKIFVEASSIEQNNKMIILQSLIENGKKYLEQGKKDARPLSYILTGIIFRAGDVRHLLKGRLKDSNGKALNTKRIEELLGQMNDDGVVNRFTLGKDKKNRRVFYKLNPEISIDHYGRIDK